jgi:hypothetical protein
MIERSPFKIKRTDDGKYQVVDPAYPEANTSCYVRGTFETQIEAINCSTALWSELLKAQDAEKAKNQPPTKGLESMFRF